MRAAAAALHDLLATAALSAPARAAVVHRMAAASRQYHGLGHIALLWIRHRRFGGGTPFRAPRANRLIACAIAFHDAVYDTRGTDNEQRSAQLWRRWAPRDLSRAEVARVSDMILATANHLATTAAATARDRLRLWLLDLDLTPLGEPPHRFARNTRDLRAEYRHLSDTDREHNRLGFLRQLQAAPRIFRSAPLAAAFEQPARRNIARELGEGR